MRMQRLTLCLLIVFILSGCTGLEADFSALSVGGEPAYAAQANDASPTPAYVLAGPGATPTPTPFQPVPPTPVVWPTDVPTPTPELEATPTPEPPVDEGEQQALDQLSGQINILLLGADARPRSTNFRTDTIILVTLNADLGTVNVTSFPRDLYITVPGWGLQRINSAWPYGKYKLLAATFQHNFGIRPDYYALLKFSSFKQIIDSLGGLDVHVGKKLSDYRAGYWVTIPAGEVHMDADTVLWYVRSRKTTNDFARNQRQQEVLQALFFKLISMNALRRVPELYEQYRGGIMTDIELVNLLTWLPLAAKVAENPENIHYYAITYGQVYDYITPYGAMVLLPDRQKVMKVIKKSQNLDR